MNTLSPTELLEQQQTEVLQQIHTTESSLSANPKEAVPKPEGLVQPLTPDEWAAESEHLVLPLTPEEWANESDPSAQD